MGWFDRFMRIKDPVRGAAQVVSTTRAPHAATSGNCRMHLVVTVPGHPAFPVDEEFIVKVKKWPHPGQTLPIEASQSDPTSFRILWDEIEDWDVGAGLHAQQLAAAMNNQPPPEPGGRPGRAGTPMVMINGRPATPEELQQYEVMTGMDLDGDGTVAGATAAARHGAAMDVPGAADDRVAALERLAALRDSGVLTDAEFQAEKARILRSE